MYIILNCAHRTRIPVTFSCELANPLHRDKLKCVDLTTTTCYSAAETKLFTPLTTVAGLMYVYIQYGLRILYLYIINTYIVYIRVYETILFALIIIIGYNNVYACESSHL